MRNVISLAVAASLVAGTAASHHNHQHLHAKKESPRANIVEREPEVVTEWVAGPTAVVYQLAGEVVDEKEAKKGIKDGLFAVIGETTPTFSPPPPPPKPTTTSVALGAQFLEEESTTVTPKPTTTSTPPPPPPTSSAKPSPKSGGGDPNADFPSGEIDCSEFPESWGAVPADWLNFNKWTGLQVVPDYSPGVKISTIHTGVDESDCVPGTMCSFACPYGYQKGQFPAVQGATLQSIGGLYCNSEGKLELTSDTNTKLCTTCEGGVTVTNELEEVVTLCRTDYPGTENMVIPIETFPGETDEVCNPSQDYYIWNDMATSAQYYLNKKGYTKEETCQWVMPGDPEGGGNWAPTIFGTGKAKDGVTYLSLFANLPTSHAKLDYNVEIVGDVTTECAYVNGKYTGGGDGCTVCEHQPRVHTTQDANLDMTDWPEGWRQGFAPLFLIALRATGTAMDQLRHLDPSWTSLYMLPRMTTAPSRGESLGRWVDSASTAVVWMGVGRSRGFAWVFVLQVLPLRWLSTAIDERNNEREDHLASPACRSWPDARLSLSGFA